MLLLAAALVLAQQTDSTLVREFEAVLRTNPVERIDSVASTTGVRGAILADIDADGDTEAIVWIAPGLRQTPTVLLFSRNAGGAWQRIAEGLAPGRLSRVTNQSQDTHRFGSAADFSAGDGSPAIIERILTAGLSAGSMSLVAYKGFVHGDVRRGSVFVLNLQSWALPPDVTNTCAAFEFPAVESVVVGTLRGAGSDPFLVALTGEDITFYRITAISEAGRLSVTSVLRKRERGVQGLELQSDGSIALRVGARLRPLTAP